MPVAEPAAEGPAEALPPMRDPRPTRSRAALVHALLFGVFTLLVLALWAYTARHPSNPGVLLVGAVVLFGVVPLLSIAGTLILFWRRRRALLGFIGLAVLVGLLLVMPLVGLVSAVSEEVTAVGCATILVVGLVYHLVVAVAGWFAARP